MAISAHASKTKVKSTAKKLRGPQSKSPVGHKSIKVLQTKPVRARGAWSTLALTKRLKGLQAHDFVTAGIPVSDVTEFLDALRIIDHDAFYKVIGISPRTLQRRAASKAQTLDSNASDRALRLVSVTEQAIETLGSQETAERWLSTPAMGLDQRKPLDLLRSTEGTELVKTLLTRMEYGVYS